MRILDQGSTIPAPIDYEGILKMEGTSSLQTLHMRQLSNSDSVVVQIIDPLVGAASCQGLGNLKAPLARRATAAVAVAAAAGRPGRCGRPC